VGLVAAFVRNPVKVAVGVLLVLLFGLIALDRMPMQLTPEVQRPIITIETRWPGASPQEVEREIVLEQEEQLKGVEGVVKMSSECLDSTGRVTLEFGTGTDMSAAILKVATRLQQVREYPEEAKEPVISTSSSSDQAIAWFILRERLPTPAELDAFVRERPHLAEALAPARRARSSGSLQRRLAHAAVGHPEVASLLPPDQDIAKLRRFAEDVIEARFERVPGVSNSNLFGGEEDEVQIVVDPERLAVRQLTIADLRRALRTTNRDTSGGDFWEGKRRYVVRTLGQFASLRDVQEVVVARRDGVPVYVRDVAIVRYGFKKPSAAVRNLGADVIAINCVRDRGANVVGVMEELYVARRELNEGVLRDRGLQLDQVYDETEYIHSAVGLVKQNILFGGSLTVLVLLVFLRSVRSTFVIALAIPTSIIGTFLILGLLGRSLNVVSLAGLAFAVGMLVDNAVVVLENVYRHYQLGTPRVEAAVRGTTEVWGAVVASTLTTLAVFIPILFVEEEAGQLFRDIALAISASVGLSLVVSVTLIPTLTSRILPRSNVHAEALGRPPAWHALLHPAAVLGRSVLAAVTAAQRWLERGVLRQVALVLLLVGGAVLGTVLLMPKVEYLPTGNRNLVLGFVQPPPGYNLGELIQLGQGVEQSLAPYWDSDPEDPAARELPFPPLQHFFFVAAGRQVFMGMRAVDPLDARKLVPLVFLSTSGIPGTFGFGVQSSLFEQGLSAGRSIDIEIRGPDLGRLVAIGGRIMGRIPGVVPGAQQRPIPSLDLSNPEVHVVPRWEKAADLDVTAEALGYVVDSLVDGAYAGDFYRGGAKIDLTIVGREDFANRTHRLDDIVIATPTGDLVPLSAIADIRLSSGPEQINRRERERAITIQVGPPETTPLGQAIEDIETQILAPLRADGTLGGEYRITLSGTADKLIATWKALRFNVFLALVITYLLLAALFESWIQPLIIIVSVPLGAVGGFLGIQALNRFVLPDGVVQSLDVLTMLGFVILIGTVVNNAILIVHQALVLMREEGRGGDEAVLAAVRTRLRPIFMTVTTTIVGLLPLVLVPGAGSELYRGLGSVLIGGLFVSTVFTLFLVPTLFRLGQRTAGYLRRLLRLGAAEAA
jgi:HAE1 family hydrophobic/amphiphilic exporter-1